ncbi:MAG TPA: methyltransferase domain-containing protein [Candidatus Cloacimonadota bacterium]|nr:methyltransferase domain-containing protein [Candidatus Cloacimonadota bacterium]
MRYEPLKDILASLLKCFPQARCLLFAALDLLLLRQSYVKAAIRNYTPPETAPRMYDAGAGYCQYSWFMLRNWQHSKVFALDLKVDYIRAFSAWLDPVTRARFSFTEGDLQFYQPKNSYDIITAIDILEHIPDDLAVLRNFYTCLKPGGKLIISTPSDTDEAARFTAEHVRPGYAMEDLRTKLESVGFEIIESRYSYGFWGSLAWKLSIRIPLNMIGRSKVFMLVLPFYYLPILPLSLLFNKLDTQTFNPVGTGILMVAGKDQ